MFFKIYYFIVFKWITLALLDAIIGECIHKEGGPQPWFSVVWSIVNKTYREWDLIFVLSVTKIKITYLAAIDLINIVNRFNYSMECRNMDTPHKNTLIFICCFTFQKKHFWNFAKLICTYCNYSYVEWFSNYYWITRLRTD